MKIGNAWLRRGAVTLIELVMILMIMGIIGAIAAPRLSTALRRQRLDLAGRSLVQDIQLARVQAIRDNANTTITFDLVNQQYTLSGQAGNRISTTIYSVTMKRQGDSRVELLAASFGGAPLLTFNKFGIPVSSGFVTIDDGVEKQILTISATTGRVTRTTSSYP